MCKCREMAGLTDHLPVCVPFKDVWVHGASRTGHPLKASVLIRGFEDKVFPLSAKIRPTRESCPQKTAQLVLKLFTWVVYTAWLSSL